VELRAFARFAGLAARLCTSTPMPHGQSVSPDHLELALWAILMLLDLLREAIRRGNPTDKD